MAFFHYFFAVHPDTTFVKRFFDFTENTYNIRTLITIIIFIRQQWLLSWLSQRVFQNRIHSHGTGSKSDQFTGIVHFQIVRLFVVLQKEGGQKKENRWRRYGLLERLITLLFSYVCTVCCTSRPHIRIYSQESSSTAGGDQCPNKSNVCTQLTRRAVALRPVCTGISSKT